MHIVVDEICNAMTHIVLWSYSFFPETLKYGNGIKVITIVAGLCWGKKKQHVMMKGHGNGYPSQLGADTSAV